jgi:hypothetical protein
LVVNTKAFLYLAAMIMPVALNSKGDPSPEPTPHETQDKIYFLLQEAKGKPRELSVDKNTVEEISSVNVLGMGPLLGLSALAVAGVDCCPPVEKLSDTVWRCCDGKKTIVTNSPTLSKVLAETREVKRTDWEKYKRDKHIMAGEFKELDKLIREKNG